MMAKQKSFEGMEDRRIAEIEDLAVQYAEIRDKRMALTKEEVGLNARLLTAMRKAKSGPTGGGTSRSPSW